VIVADDTEHTDHPAHLKIVRQAKAGQFGLGPSNPSPRSPRGKRSKTPARASAEAIPAKDRPKALAVEPLPRITDAFLRLQTMLGWLGEGLTPRQVADRAAKTFGIGRHTASQYAATAVAILQRDNKQEPLESKKARVVATTTNVLQMAMGQAHSYVTKDGVRHIAAKPDLKAATAALQFLAELEGVRPK
jgi:hypothetical protein